MKKFLIKLAELALVVLVAATPMMMAATTGSPVYAKPAQGAINADGDGEDETSGDSNNSEKNNCVKTAILGENGESCDDGTGSSVKNILKIVVEIMTVGVGILSVIGISVVGVQYLTAGGDEAKTRKAKRRMFEIIIGVALYVAAFALMSWLIPDFKPFQ